MEASLAKSILTDAPMGVIAVDPAGAIRSANGTAERLFGRPLVVEPPLSIESLLPPFRLSHLADRAQLAEFNTQGWAGGGGRHFDAAAFDGRTVSVDIQVARFSARGEPYFTLFLQDITALIAARDAVDELRKQLIYRWRLNSMGEMAAMLAHELNQPLAAIGNYLYTADRALGRGDVDQARRLIEAARSQNERAGDTIRHMRSLLSRDTGYQRAVDPHAMVRDLLPLMSMTAREVGAELRIDLVGAEAVICDKVQIQQLLMNLVRNSVDAVRARPLRQVVVSGRAVADALYEFRIDDTGPGVAPEAADRIFEPMTSTKPDGMGLGLSICRTIVEAHGGAISHQPGRLGGAAFVFTLKRGEALPQ